MDPKDKIAVISGASSGIGLATARLLSARGAKLVLASRSRDKLVDLARQMEGSMAIPADLSHPDEVAGLVAAARRYFGRIDILVNAAGRGYDAPVELTNIETVRAIFDLDYVAPLLAMKQVVPVMRQQGGGLILNVSSGTALRHLPNMGAYSSLKLALASLSLTAREELKKDNIRVVVFYPYMTLTAFEDNTIKDVLESPPTQPAPGSHPPPPPDTAEFAAQKVLEGILSEAPEIFAHDWMTNR